MIDCSKTENYFTEKRRMTKRPKDGPCGICCVECPLFYTNNGSLELMGCSGFEMYCPEQAVKAVQQWSDEHPQKTYLTELLKNYPNVQLKDDGTPVGICPHHLGLINKEDCKNRNCIECWNQPIEDGEENV